ncbi:VOC family protein [Bradyrhizobium tropiciagri]|uniref:VOC family protein n=1 Tax=Bradyrhizobium tropiciagri TaxID=312253 RepID=UPI001BA627BF|nr:VOC family protein [Bradyrhizobium tropiciagri]MBR0875066.1 VOC family protein [Bradyrhizobium tropiciagri]
MIEGGPAFRIESTEHTGITVASLDSALAFWSGVMGFEHIYTWDFGKDSFLEHLVGVKSAAARIAMVRGPGHLIELLEYYSPDDRRRLTPRSCDVGSVHVAYRVVNIDALLARIGAAGWHALSDVQLVRSGDRAGLRLVYVRGPDGVTLELLEYPHPKPTP